ncbi:serine/threonine-protein kinase [Mycolicibacterium goodii]|uniref:serine/threonine-protein kinase n=1 Tax=Mycolicibacterium goodii TaxID=134601 RepID=UPI0027DF584D|nr:serine/threonine-protein kinase [Mycolicibacterium goodii]
MSVFAVGALVAGYRIEQVLATGATGTVYVAKNPTLPRRDALKVLSADLSRDPAFRERFVREADIASLLNHPNIVPIYSRGEADDGQLWIAMQYVEGTDAEAALQAGTMTTRRALRIVSEVAKALDYAHQRDVVHHDVKPANILLAPEPHGEEHVLLSDFGVARAAGGADDSDDDATLAVTLAYAAPEVITGGAVDGRADIYSLACTLFRLLTGKQPFYNAQGTTALALAHLHQPPPRISEHLPGATPQLDAVMARALAKNPADRYDSAREFTAAAAAAATRAPRRHPSDNTAIPPAPRSQPRPPEFRKSFDEPITVTPILRQRRETRPLVIIWAVFAVIALIAVILWIKVIARWSDSPHGTAAPASTTATTSPAAIKLNRLLPAGYPAGTCTPTPADGDAVAAVSCGPNVDPGGPTSSSFTLSTDLSALRASFTDVVNRSTARICPPNIQSPGPWRRNDSPTVVRGTLFCGLQAGQPVVAWTEDDKLLLSVVRAAQPAATLDALYAWWTAHS